MTCFFKSKESKLRKEIHSFLAKKKRGIKSTRERKQEKEAIEFDMREKNDIRLKRLKKKKKLDGNEFD